MPPAAVRPSSPEIAPTAEVSPRTRPVTRPTAAAPRASAPAFACCRGFCIAVSFRARGIQERIEAEPLGGLGDRQQRAVVGPLLGLGEYPQLHAPILATQRRWH